MAAKKKWGDLTTLSAPLDKKGKIDPNYHRIRAWREAHEFNGLRLPSKWRWKLITCHCCGTVKNVKEYAGWRWVWTGQVPPMDKSIARAIEDFAPTLEKAYAAKSGFARFFNKENGR